MLFMGMAFKSWKNYAIRFADPETGEIDMEKVLNDESDENDYIFEDDDSQDLPNSKGVVGSRLLSRGDLTSSEDDEDDYCSDEDEDDDDEQDDDDDDSYMTSSVEEDDEFDEEEEIEF